ncbi:MAG: aminopeptidase [Lachnospiraceae bacterium]|jgi:aminopeptidase|nr:aminopeptidase [Lachnospiraceae bacterium]
MFDERIRKIAFQLVDYSLDIKEGEVVRIVANDFESKPLVKEILKELTKRKAVGIVEWIDHEVQALEQVNATDKGIELHAKWELERTKDMDAYLLIKGRSNDYETNIVPQEKAAKIMASKTEIQDIRVNHRKWVLLNYPTNFFANKAKMGYDQYQDYFFDVMLVDYRKMYEDSLPLKELMDKTDKVHIIGPGTDLTFSIKGIGAVICAGDKNVPDGEVYSAPVRESMNGTVQYNTITSQQGIEFKNVGFNIKNGKIIEAHSDVNNDKINEMLDSDEGARYFGEFSLGTNPKINSAVGDILFDEKIYGSFHLTPGQAYDDADNGNDSMIHWDLVCVQTKEYGGGEVWFDDVLIRKDGEFVIDSLKNLNK